MPAAAPSHWSIRRTSSQIAFIVIAALEPHELISPVKRFDYPVPSFRLLDIVEISRKK